MRKTIVALGAVFAAMSFASLSPLMAVETATDPVKQEKPDKPANEFKMVHGAITKIDGQTLTVEGKVGDARAVQTVTFTYTDKTEIVKAKVAYTEPLKVGDKITAKLDKSDVAARIELRSDKPKPVREDKKHGGAK